MSEHGMPSDKIMRESRGYVRTGYDFGQNLCEGKCNLLKNRHVSRETDNPLTKVEKTLELM